MTAAPGPGGGVLRSGNDILAFLLELVALAALCYWGAVTGHGPAARIALGAGAPVAAAVLWGLFAAPRARYHLPLAGVLAVKALVFGAATAALIATGHLAAGVAFAVVVVANTTLATVQRRRAP